MFNKYFDELQVGERWVSGGRTITEADVVMFAALSGDWHPLHTDKEWAAKNLFKQRIAHGLLVLSVSTGLMKLAPGPIAAFYGMERVRFVEPTYIGDTIHIEAEVLELIERDNDTGVVTFKTEIKDGQGEIKVTSITKTLFNKKMHKGRISE